MCGEHLCLKHQICPLLGSPPHVRGTLAPNDSFLAYPRITPACAGNTRLRQAPLEPRADHPRMCGEHGGKRMGWVPGKGSPPHVRGTRQHPSRRSGHPRITPACAGNTPGFYLPWCFWEDHPRMCGEHYFCILAHRPFSGSPPHVRGTLHPSLSPSRSFGITPACAGNTYIPSRSCLPRQDHPRMCGEHAGSLA